MFQPLMPRRTLMHCASVRACYQIIHWLTARASGSLPKLTGPPQRSYCPRNIDLTATDNTGKFFGAVGKNPVNINIRLIGLLVLAGIVLAKNSPTSPPAMILFEPEQWEKWEKNSTASRI
jgi:hypothetical protein